MINARSTLAPRDFTNLKYILSLDKKKFDYFYSELDDWEQKYLLSLLETYRLDILDHAFNLDFKGVSSEVLEIINKIK